MATKDDINWAHQIRNDLFLFNAQPDFTDVDINDLFKILVIADDTYHNSSTPVLHDEEYDAIHLFCETADASNTYFLGIGSDVRGGKVKLPHAMGSLTQAYVGGDIHKWVNQYNLANKELVITEKLDGISALLVYGVNGKLQIAYSRGNGIEGADITRHVSKIKNVPKQISGRATIRAEIIFKKSDWHIAKTKITRSGGALYKNTRNATAGLMNASEGDPVAYQYLSVVAYDVLSQQDKGKIEQLSFLDSNGFITPLYHTINGSQATDEYLTKILNIFRTKSNYEIDGIVIDVESALLRSKINPTTDTLNPEYARKYKITDASNYAESEVTQVEWRTSKNGYAKPRLHIRPIDLIGVTVTHATGYNAKYIVDNKINVGSIVAVSRMGEVVPNVVRVIKGSSTPSLPEGDRYVWTSTGVDLVLVNANDNETVQREQLIDFVTKMGFEYIGEGNVEKIFDAGYKTPGQLITMSEFEITQVIGSVNGKKIFKSIREKTTNVPWYIVAGSVPFFGRGVGRRKMKKLYDAFEGDITKLHNESNIVGVEGFEQKTATKIVAGYNEFMNFVDDTGIVFAQYEAPKSGSLSGQTYLFTGFRSSDLEAKIVEQGGKISSSVSSKLTYLVAADVNEHSGKLKKARELGTKIISREELIELLGGQ